MKGRFLTGNRVIKRAKVMFFTFMGLIGLNMLVAWAQDGDWITYPYHGEQYDQIDRSI